MKRIRKVAAVFLAAGALGILVLSIGPWLLTRHPSQSLTAEQRLKARNDARTTLVQAVGAAGLIGGLFFTYRTYRLTTSQQVTDRYAKATEQLGHASEDVRTGAIYGLERVMKDSPHDAVMILAVLTSFASRRSAESSRHRNLSPDLQAALLVISRHRPGKRVNINLAGARMIGAPLAALDLSGAVMDKATLNDANFAGSNLRNVSLVNASMIETNLANCDLSGADLTRAKLVNADLRGARLDNAKLEGAKFSRTRLNIGALTDAQLASLADSSSIEWTVKDDSPTQGYKR